MTKISPWFLLLGVLFCLVTFSTVDRTAPGFWTELLAFPAYIVVLVAMDHLILPRMQWPDETKARVRAITSLVLTAFVVWAMRPSPIVSGLLILVAFQGIWSALSGGRR